MLTIYKQVHARVESYEQQQLAEQNGTLVTRLVPQLSTLQNKLRTQLYWFSVH